MPSFVQLSVEDKELLDRADIMKSWHIYNKIAGSLAQGERLANLSWRLWSLRSGPAPHREVQLPSGLLDTLDVSLSLLLFFLFHHAEGIDVVIDLFSSFAIVVVYFYHIYSRFP